MPQHIIRVIKDKNNPYVQINKTALHDPRLSWKAKGLFAYMLSMPDDWVFRRDELIEHSTDGRKGLLSALKELQLLGYVKIHPDRAANGRIICWHTTVFETPECAKKHHQELTSNTEKPLSHKDSHQNPKKENVAKGECGKGTTTKNDLTKKENTKKDIYTANFLSFWDRYPKKEGSKPATAKAFDNACKRGSQTQVMDGLRRWEESGTKPQYWNRPKKWLDDDMWMQTPISQQMQKGAQPAKSAIERALESQKRFLPTETMRSSAQC